MNHPNIDDIRTNHRYWANECDRLEEEILSDTIALDRKKGLRQTAIETTISLANQLRDLE